jgi:uncharacterized protein involved in tolerance to divalent cations
VTTACANDEDAGKIAAALLLRKLAACVQMFPVNSRYVWKGEMREDKEILLLIKCRRAHDGDAHSHYFKRGRI